MKYCISVKLIASIFALIWIFPNPQFKFTQGFVVGVLPIWAEVLASHLARFEPARDPRRTWLLIDAVVDAVTFLLAPVLWWRLTLLGPASEFYLGAGLFIGSGLFRIIRFVKHGLDERGYFQGLPVTYTGYIWPFLPLLPKPLQSPWTTAILLTAAIAMALPNRFIKASR